MMVYSDDEDDDDCISPEGDDINECAIFIKTKPCEICTKNEAKYECPNCAMRTCSLKCCLAHKSKVLFSLICNNDYNNCTLVFYSILALESAIG